MYLESGLELSYLVVFKKLLYVPLSGFICSITCENYVKAFISTVLPDNKQLMLTLFLKTCRLYDYRIKRVTYIPIFKRTCTYKVEISCIKTASDNPTLSVYNQYLIYLGRWWSRGGKCDSSGSRVLYTPGLCPQSAQPVEPRCAAPGEDW